jgi:hypothetical protein
MDDGFVETVRREIADILNRKYRTTRRGGHPSDEDESLRDRAFWPDMRFHQVAQYQTAQGTRGLAITFTPIAEQESLYGFKIDMVKSLAAWGQRVVIRSARDHPSMFAAELIWYMVAYISSVDIRAFPTDASGVRWVNEGSEMFTRLPESQARKPTGR